MLEKISHALACRNIVKRPVRSAAMMALALFLSLSVFAGTMIESSLKKGFSSLQSRLGADIMVVPYEAATKSDLENIVLQGNTGYFYMNGEIYDEISQIPGVGRITPQYYLASASASCCSIPVQIIGYDPATDFVITPWIKKSRGGDIGYLDVVVGNDLNAFVGDTLSFYGTEVHVAAKLDKTGTNYDTAVFTNKETIQTLIQSSLDKKLNEYGSINAGNVVSCILIDVAEGSVVEEVLNDINIHYKKVKAVRTKNMISGIADSLAGVSDVAGVLIALVWILALLVMVVAFSMMVNERKKEFAILRVVGASRGRLSRIVLEEGLLVSLIGSIAGVVIGLLVIVPFSNYIELRLGLPFLLPDAASIAGTAAGSVALATAAGACASCLSAYQISRIDTGMILREAN